VRVFLIPAVLLAAGIIAAPLSCQRGGIGRPAPEFAPGEDPDLRVRVVEGATRVTLAGPPMLAIRLPNGTVTSVEPPVTVSLRGGALLLAPGSGAERTLDGREGAHFEPVRGGTASPLLVNGVPYPGSVLIHPRSDAPEDRFDVIEMVQIEAYLPGVVARELYASWPLETYKVQAICARTYALHERARARAAGRHFDVESTTADQAYAGTTDRAVALAGVAQTRGVVVSWRGRLLRTYYSSTCGGRGGSAADCWPTGPGYEFNFAEPIQAHARPFRCQDSPLFRWEVTRTESDVSTRLGAWARATDSAWSGRVRAIEPAGTSAAGRPARFRVVDDSGRVITMSAESLRTALNAPAGALPAAARAERLASGDVEVIAEGGSLRFRGRGFGHGVGMCQFCAKGMADAGDDWMTMLRRFYPGATIERAY
jgi:stage II sporulation protein D